MKRLLVLFLLSLPALAQYPTTPNLGLQLPPHATGPGWGIALNQNAVVLDTLFSNGACGGDGVHAVILTGNPLKFGCSTVANTGLFVQLDPLADQTITGPHGLLFSDPAASIWLKTSASTGGLAIGSVQPGNDGFSGNDLIIQDQWTGAVSGNQFYGILMNNVYDPAVSQAGSIWGIFNDVSSASDSTANGTSLIGYESHVIANSPGSVGSVQAAVYSAGVGASGGSPSFIFGLQVHAINSGTGISPTNQAIKVTSTGAGGASSVVTDNRSIEIDSPVVTGTLTHNYGIYIQDQGLGGANNPDSHGIFEEGTTPNDLGGGVTKVGVLNGTTVNGTTGVFTGLTISGISGSVQCLHVNSAGLISGTGADCGAAGGGAVSSVSGTANQIDVVNGSTTPTVSIDPTFTFPGTVTNNLSIFGSTTSAQLAGIISNETGTGSLVFGTSPTIVTPTIASFTNATHNHTNAAGGGALSLLTGAFANQGTTSTVLHGNGAGNVSFGSVVNNDIAAGTIDLTAKVTGILPVANGGNGTSTPSLLAGTNITVTGVWPAQTISTSAGGTVTHTAGALTANAVMLGNGTADSKVLASLGTTTTLLHGNAAGAPTYSGVAIADHTATGTPSSSTFLRGDNTWATPTGTGTVTTTGSPASTQVALMSGSTSITGDSTYNFNSTTKNVQQQGMISGATPMLDPRSSLFGSCKGDGTDTAAAATACWQAAEAYMQAHGGSVVCPGDTTWTLNRVLVNNDDTFQGIGNQNPTLTCTINVSVDAAFVAANPALGNLSTGWTGAVLSGATFRNMFFVGGVNPIDITLGNQETYENLQFRDSSGCGISHVTGERAIFSNISSGHLSVNGFATLCTGDQTKSLFSASLSGGTALGLARSKFDSIFEGGASPTHFSQWAWFGGTLANGGNIGESVVNRVGCFFSCSVGVMQFGGGTNDLFDGLYMDSIADGLSAAPVGFNFVGEYDGVRWSGIDFGNSGGNTTTQMVIQTCTGCTVQNSWFSQGVDNASTFGLKLGATFGGSLVGVRGGVFATNPGSINALGSYNLTPSNLRAGSGSFGPQIVDQNNTDSYYGLCNAFCASADTATAHFYRSTGSGAFADDLALSSTAATFGHPIATPAATKALSTSAIGAHTCSSAQTVTMTGAATTSVIKWSFASTPIGVTGYGDATTPFLVVTTFPTANTANVVVCNTSASSITPGAISVNLRLEE